MFVTVIYFHAMPDWSFACKYQTRDKVTESDKLAYYVAESIPTIKSYIKCRPRASVM
jgi:hypothetical protein